MQKKAKMSLEKRHNLTGWAFLTPGGTSDLYFLLLPDGAGTDPFFLLKKERVGAPLSDWQITREF